MCQIMAMEQLASHVHMTIPTASYVKCALTPLHSRRAILRYLDHCRKHGRPGTASKRLHSSYK